MDENLQSQIATYLSHLEGLIHRGRQLRDALAADPSSRPALTSNRVWQQDCALAINQLSGGSKAHWLARSFSEAFLMRSADGRAVEGAPAAEIVQRIVGVLEQAVSSLSGMRSGPAAPASSEETTPHHRFQFVHNPELRPIVAQAYADGRIALEEGRFGAALLSLCGTLEAIVTDALEHAGASASAAAGAPPGNIGDWPFQARLDVAAKLGLIHGGYTRLPPVAYRYRELVNAGTENGAGQEVSEQDARRAGQVLRVVMRDLDPGR